VYRRARLSRAAWKVPTLTADDDLSDVNLALKAVALGGVFVGGGIAPKIRAKLAAGVFLAAFSDKGRYRDLLASIPVRLVLEPRAPLRGAARVARNLLGRR